MTAMKDRYASLMRLSLLIEDDEELPLWRREEAAESDITPETEAYFKQIQKQKIELKSFHDAVKEVSGLHNLLLGALEAEPDVDAVKEAISRLDVQFTEVDNQCSLISRRINELRATLARNCKSQMDMQVRKNQLMSLSEPFRNLLMKFNADYVHYQEASRKKAVDYAKSHDIDNDRWNLLLRQNSVFPNAKLVSSALPHSRVLIEQEEPVSPLSPEMNYTQLRRSSGAFAAVFHEIKERHETIDKVEKSIGELENLYHQLQFHIMETQEPAAIIENKIEETKDFTQMTQLETTLAVEKHKIFEKRRKIVTKIRISLILLIILVVILLILVLKLFITFLLRIHQ